MKRTTKRIIIYILVIALNTLGIYVYASSGKNTESAKDLLSKSHITAETIMPDNSKAIQDILTTDSSKLVRSEGDSNRSSEDLNYYTDADKNIYR